MWLREWFYVTEVTITAHGLGWYKKKIHFDAKKFEFVFIPDNYFICSNRYPKTTPYARPLWYTPINPLHMCNKMNHWIIDTRIYWALRSARTWYGIWTVSGCSHCCSIQHVFSFCSFGTIEILAAVKTAGCLVRIIIDCFVPKAWWIIQAPSIFSQIVVLSFIAMETGFIASWW